MFSLPSFLIHPLPLLPKSQVNKGAGLQQRACAQSSPMHAAAWSRPQLAWPQRHPAAPLSPAGQACEIATNSTMHRQTALLLLLAVFVGCVLPSSLPLCPLPARRQPSPSALPARLASTNNCLRQGNTGGRLPAVLWGSLPQERCCLWPPAWARGPRLHFHLQLP